MMTRFSFYLALIVLMITISTATHAAYNKPFIGKLQTYTATDEDTLVEIARKFELGFVEARAANPYIDPWFPGAGTEVTIPSRHLLPKAPHKGIVINIPEMRIYAYVNGDKAPNTFPIAIGREGLETPIGQTKIVRKKEGPTWRPTQRMLKEDPSLDSVVPPGPENPLGTHALYLGWPTYAIHGTNKPFGIGRRASSGCIRMYPEHITKFYGQIPVGTNVTVVNQPIKLAWVDGELLLEAHPDLDQAIQMEETGLVTSHRMSEDDLELITKAAGLYHERLNWSKIRTAVRERSGIPIAIARNPNFVDGEDISDISSLEIDSDKKADKKPQPKKSAPVATPRVND